VWHEPISEDAEEELTCLASEMPPAAATGTAGQMPSFRHTRSTGSPSSGMRVSREAGLAP